jgi:hypothetical protein
MAWAMPIKDVSLPDRLPYIGGWTFSLNPGEIPELLFLSIASAFALSSFSLIALFFDGSTGIFNIKEHALISIMVCASAIQPYALQASIASSKYYNVEFAAG